MVQLDKRLARMAELMTPGGVGIDVGADHGYLSVSLVASGKAKRMLATDIRPGPLSSAERCIRENGLQDRIGTMLTDGLNGVALEGATDILIGGMGGLLIAGILQARLPELKEFNLVLQPMTQAAALRQWLCDNGFEIISERCAVAASKAYSIINARYDGVKRECDPFFALVGKAAEDDSEDADIYLQTLLSREQKTLSGLMSAASPDEEKIAHSRELAERLQKLLDQRATEHAPERKECRKS